MMSEFIKTEAALLPVDILRQANINFACRFRHKDIKQVIFNNPATVVFWGDGTRTVVKCSKDDAFDPEIGLAMAICKKAFGNTGAYNEVFKKWVPKVKIEAMRRMLAEHCHGIAGCGDCILGGPMCRCGRGAFFVSPKGSNGYMTDEEIVDAYNRVFGK